MMRTPLRLMAPLLMLLALAGCKTELNSGLTEMAANDELALLLRHDIPAARAADVKAGTYSVVVEQARFADAVDLLRAHGLPQQHYDSVPDVFKGGGLVSSPTEERARMTYALGESLSRTIAEIDGVLSARVHIVAQDTDPLLREAPPASAAVFVRYKPDSAAGGLVPQIKMLVANGIGGLSYDKVSVVMVPAVLAADVAPERGLQNVYGMWVDGESAPALRGLMAGVAGMLATLAVAAGWSGWRARHVLMDMRVLGRRLPGRPRLLGIGRPGR